MKKTLLGICGILALTAGLALSTAGPVVADAGPKVGPLLAGIDTVVMPQRPIVLGIEDMALIHKRPIIFGRSTDDQTYTGRDGGAPNPAQAANQAFPTLGGVTLLATREGENWGATSDDFFILAEGGGKGGKVPIETKV